jgi:hypothetical protein
MSEPDYWMEPYYKEQVDTDDENRRIDAQRTIEIGRDRTKRDLEALRQGSGQAPRTVEGRLMEAAAPDG